MKVCSVCQRCYEDNVLSCIEENHNSFNDDHPGTCEIVSGFRLDSLLKCEATGKTYKATNLLLNEPCLIKIFTVSPVADQQKLTQQFLHEAQSIASLNHPNLVRIYKPGVLESGEFYVITEDTGGKTLRDCLINGTVLSEITAIQIARQTAEGLEAVHTAGITHRHLNPENIILTSDLEHRLLVKLQNFDFGGINQQIITSDNSNSGERLSNLRYFSPEQCAGQTVDPQTDIYSLGIVLYEMLSGKVPFESANADELIHKQKSVPPPEIKILNFDIRALLTYTLMDSLQKIPRLRLKKAGSFARQLRHIEQLITHSPAPPPAIANPPVTNNVMAAVQPQIQNIEPLPIPTNFNEIFEENSFSAPEIHKVIDPEPITENVVLPLPENVIENIEVEKEFDSQPEVNFVEEAKVNNISTASMPVLVDWEQPEDIPSEEEVLEVRQKEFGEAEFASAEHFVEDEHVTFEPPSVINIVIENDDIRRDRTGKAPIFAQYSGNQSGYLPIVNQLPLIGAGLVILISLVVVGSSLIGYKDPLLQEQTSVKAPPKQKILPKPVEPEIVSKEETEPLPNPEELEANNNKPLKDISDVSEPKISDVKKRPNLLPSAAKRTVQNQTNKDVSENKVQTNGSNVEGKSLNKDVIIIVPSQDKKNTNGKSLSTNGLTRPRIVKTRIIP